MLKKINEFFYTLYLVLVGDLRADKYEDLEDHLMFLKTQLSLDRAWLSSIPEMEKIATRHYKMSTDEWRDIKFATNEDFKKEVLTSVQQERLHS